MNATVDVTVLLDSATDDALFEGVDKSIGDLLVLHVNQVMANIME